jgi:hypothetical protein
MQYLLMCCFDEKSWEKIPESQRDGIMQEYGEVVQGLVKSGHYLSGAKLKSTSAATTVRGGKNGRPVITDGPFAETKEQLGGYHLVECKDLNEALSIAARIPTLRVGGTIEVRPVEAPSGR